MIQRLSRMLQRLLSSLRQLPSQRPGLDGGDCSICLENLALAAGLARPSSCQHFFCRVCLERLCKENPTSAQCPLDRQLFRQYAVSRLGVAGEVIHDVETRQPLKQMFSSQTAPLLLGCVLLVALWFSPSWSLALRILALSGVFIYTDGLKFWQFYIINGISFFVLVLPALHISPLAEFYTWLFVALLVRWIGQLLKLRTVDATPEKLLFGFTLTLLLLVWPAAHLFSFWSGIGCSLTTSFTIYAHQICAHLFGRFATDSEATHVGLLIFQLVVLGVLVPALLF